MSPLSPPSPSGVANHPGSSTASSRRGSSKSSSRRGSYLQISKPSSPLVSHVAAAEAASEPTLDDGSSPEKRPARPLRKPPPPLSRTSTPGSKYLITSVLAQKEELSERWRYPRPRRSPPRAPITSRMDVGRGRERRLRAERVQHTIRASESVSFVAESISNRPQLLRHSQSPDVDTPSRLGVQKLIDAPNALRNAH